MWPVKRADMAKHLSRYWDARGDQTDANRLAAELDPTMTETIEQLYTQDDAQLPDLDFLNRLETTLMNTARVPLNLPPLSAPAPVLPNGRSAPPARSAWSRVVPRSPEWPRRMLAPLATAALVILVLAGSFFTFGPGRPRRLDDVPAILPAVATLATPAAGEVAEETLLESPLPAGALPHGDDLSAELAHVSVPIGDRTDWTPGDQPGETSIRVFHVVRGTLSLRATGDVQITRAGGVPESVATGTEVTLDAGDTWIGSAATGFAAANPGMEPTEVLFWVLTDAEHAKGQHFPVPGSWLFHTSLNQTDRQLGVSRLPGPATLRLRQVQLPVEGRLPAPPGALQLGLALPFNAIGTPVSSVTTSVGRLPANGTLVNLGMHATVHVLTLEPTEATSGTPTS